jgi:hypothetical protein
MIAEIKFSTYVNACGPHACFDDFLQFGDHSAFSIADEFVEAEFYQEHPQCCDENCTGIEERNAESCDSYCGADLAIQNLKKHDGDKEGTENDLRRSESSSARDRTDRSVEEQATERVDGKRPGEDAPRTPQNSVASAGELAAADSNCAEKSTTDEEGIDMAKLIDSDGDGIPDCDDKDPVTSTSKKGEESHRVGAFKWLAQHCALRSCSGTQAACEGMITLCMSFVFLSFQRRSPRHKNRKRSAIFDDDSDEDESFANPFAERGGQERRGNAI